MKGYKKIKIIPVANPDGYEFSHGHGGRLWRKNRARIPGSKCRGVDLNRNFPFHWSEVDSNRTRDACSEVYGGPKPVSEPETKIIHDYVIKNKDRIKVYISLHTFGQYWLTPWSFTKKLPKEYRNMYSAGIKATTAIFKVNGTQYQVGSTANILYFDSGTDRDWVHGVIGVPFVYTVELPPSSQKSKSEHQGFIPTPDKIIPTGLETTVGIIVLAEEVAVKLKLKGY